MALLQQAEERVLEQVGLAEPPADVDGEEVHGPGEHFAAHLPHAPDHDQRGFGRKRELLQHPHRPLTPVDLDRPRHHPLDLIVEVLERADELDRFNRVLRHAGHETALAVVPDYEAGIDELTQRFSDRRPADTVLLADLVLRREAGARWKCPGADALLEEIAEPEVERQPAPASPVAPELNGRLCVRLHG